ncbi:hypothetical protein ACWDTI_00570 [Gordonia sp. NPDC003424]
MTSILMALIGIAMLVLCALAVRQQWHVGPIALAVAAICLCLAYDCIVVAIGRLVGYGDTLEALNVPRFWIHAIVIPPIILIYGALAIRLGLHQARGRNLTLGAVALVAMLILIGVIQDGLRLQLEPENAGDALRYVNSAANAASLPAIITVLALLIIGMATMRYLLYVWLMVGALAVFVTSIFASSVLWLGGLGELVLMAALVYTLQRVGDRELSTTAPETGEET